MAAQFQHLVNSFGQEIEDKVSKNRDKDIATSFLAVHRFGFFHLQSNCTLVISASAPLTSSHKVCRRLLQYDRGNGEKHRNYGIVSFFNFFVTFLCLQNNTEIALNVETYVLVCLEISDVVERGFATYFTTHSARHWKASMRSVASHNSTFLLQYATQP